MTATFLDNDDIDTGVAAAGMSPARVGTVDLIVRRPEEDEREVLDTAQLIVGEGVAGDNYLARGSSATGDGSAHPEAQLNIMNSRYIDVLSSGDRSRWPLAGDQFFVDLDLSAENLPVGSRLRIGTALIEVAAKPHNGCAKFARRFGQDAARWVNRDKSERRRGLCAVVIEPGTVSTGDEISVV